MFKKNIERFKLDNYHYSIDFLRGLAALMVVIYHFVAKPGRFTDFEALQNIASYGHFGVQVFFVISGFVIPNSMFNSGYQIKSFLRFMLKRLARLEPPYIVSILVCIALAYVSLLSPYYRGEYPKISLPQVLLHLGYLNIYFKYEWLNVVYWSLAIEFQFYILMALLFPLLMSERKYLKFISFVIIVSLALLIKGEEFIFTHAPFFIFGIALFLFKKNKISNANFAILLVANALFCYSISNGWHLFFGLSTFLFILLTEIKNPIGLFLGSISYSLYLLHVPIGQRIINISENFVSNQYMLLLVVFASILVMLFVARIYYLLIEKPSQQLSKQISIRKMEVQKNKLVY